MLGKPKGNLPLASVEEEVGASVLRRAAASSCRMISLNDRDSEGRPSGVDAGISEVGGSLPDAICRVGVTRRPKGTKTRE